MKNDKKTKVKITKCPTAVAKGYGSMQPEYVVKSSGKKPTLDEIDLYLNHFVPQII